MGPRSSHRFWAHFLRIKTFARDLFDKAPPEALLSLFSGLIGLLSCWNALFNVHLPYFKLIYTQEDTTDWSHFVIIIMGGLAFLSSLVGAVRLTSKKLMPFEAFVIFSVLILLCNFAIGIVLTEARKKVHWKLEPAMKFSLQEAIITRHRLGVEFSLGEAWDYVHLKMHCCGIDSFRDYYGNKNIPGSEVFPLTCCVMRKEDDELLIPENRDQCQFDANRGVRSSRFIHSQGCLQGLTRWLLRYFAKVTGLLFVTICVQALSIVYSSYTGYKRSLGFRRRTN